MKKILALFLSMAMIVCMSVGIVANDFTDVKDHVNAEAIEVLGTLEIVKGYNETTYGPNDILTRAQLCTMLARALYSNDLHYNSANSFADVTLSHWARMYIDTAYRYGLMIGYGNNTFGPDDALTYTQTARTILNALGYGELAWPDGVNLVALELGLYKNISNVDYDAGCTRAHAAQMIYNAFDLEVVNDYAGIPMKTDKTFLADLLGYVETTTVENGHTYVAYMDVETQKVYTTDIVLTSEVLIYSADNGAAYRFENSYRSEKFDIDWTNTTLYVNDTIVDTNMASWFKNSDLAFGIFDTENKLVGICIVNLGTTYVPATGLNEDKLPDIVKDELFEDEDFDERLSTITYYDESGKYEISNDVVSGFVTKVTRTSIKIDDVVYLVNDSSDYDEGQYVVLYFDIYGLLADIMIVEEPYLYNIKTGTYHTWECEIYNDRHSDRNWFVGKDAVIDEILTHPDVNWLLFESCDKCHTKDKGNSLIVSLDRIEPTVTYVSVEGWNYYHVESCEYIVNTTKDTFEVDINNTELLKHDCCN